MVLPASSDLLGEVRLVDSITDSVYRGVGIGVVGFQKVDRVMRMIEIGLKELKPGCCIVGLVGDVEIAVAMGDDGKLRIFKVVEHPQSGRK